VSAIAYRLSLIACAQTAPGFGGKSGADPLIHVHPLSFVTRLKRWVTMRRMAVAPGGRVNSSRKPIV
jgi:hypothetical protein